MTSAKRQIFSWPDQTPAAKSKKPDGLIKLPEKYEILDKFFNSLDSSIRLLRLKGSMLTFSNISAKVECLTDRRFSYGHLAQLKFILPEAIEMKKILIHDERTSCMKPDLHVTLNFNVIENGGKMKSDNGSTRLRKIFHARLLDFYKAHPEGDEVPEEILPEPFNRTKEDLQTQTLKASDSSLLCETSTNALSQKQPVAASHISPCFQGHFSHRVSRNGVLDIDQEQPTESLQPPVLPVSVPHIDQNSSMNEIRAYAVPSPIKFSSKPTICEKSLASGASSTCLLSCDPPAIPIKSTDLTHNDVHSSIGSPSSQGTPAKLILTPARLMSATPALQPPKRCYMSPDNGSSRSPDKLVRRPNRSRSLKFDTPVKHAETEDEDGEKKILSVDDDISDILSENLLQQIREKERKVLEEQDPAISQAKRRREMIVSLPKLFEMIHFFFQSIKRSVITKEELMHRIIASHLDIVDRREVEEQLRLLQELIPEWIYEKSASSGDILLCINKISSPESIRARLAEAR